MATKIAKLSPTTRSEVLAYLKDAVPRSLAMDIKVRAPDLKSACQRAKNTLKVVEEQWIDAGRPRTGPIYADFITAKITAMVMCAFAGEVVP